jgi:hypothetical protein
LSGSRSVALPAARSARASAARRLSGVCEAANCRARGREPTFRSRPTTARVSSLQRLNRASGKQQAGPWS